MKLVYCPTRKVFGALVKTLAIISIGTAALLHMSIIPGGISPARAQVAGDSLYAVLYKGTGGDGGRGRWSGRRSGHD